MKILILGHNGMLGHVCKKYFLETKYDVLTLNKNTEKYNLPNSDKFFSEIKTLNPDVIINCIGLIKQKSDNPTDLLISNSIFPLHLRLRFPNIQIIHPNTDCVFSGETGNYRINDLPSPIDMYGISKALCEIILKYPNTYIIRCSFIGPERNNTNFGLLEWFLSQNNSETINGYIDHKWNGITTLEWAKCVDELLSKIKNKEKCDIDNLIQPGTKEIYTKANILHMISHIWNKNITIKDVKSSKSVDRSMMPTLIRKSLLEQLYELKEWYYKNK